MPEALPINLVIWFLVYMGLINTHQRHAKADVASPGYTTFLYLSSGVGLVVAAGLMIYYGWVTSWYWPVLLFFVDSILGGMVFGIIEGKLGGVGLSILGIPGWPICAYMVYVTISGLASQ